MAFNLNAPFFLSATGYVATGALVPADFGTLSMPVTGQRYIRWTQTYWVINSTGFSATAGSYNYFTQTGGLGFQTQNSSLSIGAPPIGATNSFVYDGTASSTTSGSFVSPTLTIRQMVAADCTGIIGVKLGFLPLN